MSEWDNNPPFYYYSIWVWNHLFEISEFSSRLMSVLFISIGISVFFLTLLKFTSFKVSIVITSLLSFNDILLYHAQQVRCYAEVFLLVIISTHLFFTFLEKKKTTNLFILGLVNFLIVYTHYIAGIVLLIQLAFALMKDRGTFIRYSTSLFIVTALVCLRFTKKQFETILGFNGDGSFWLEKPSFFDLITTVRDLSNGPLIAILMAICLVVTMYHLLAKKIQFPKNQFIIYSSVLILISILVPFFISLYKPLFLTRYFIFTIPFIISIVILTIEKVISNTRITLRIFGILIVLNIFFSKFTISRTENYRSIVTLVRALKKPNDQIVINSPDNLGLFCYYFKRDLFLNEHMTDSLKKYNIYGVRDGAELPDNSSSRLILVQQYHVIANNTNELAEIIHKTHNRTLHLNRYNGIELSVFQ